MTTTWPAAVNQTSTTGPQTRVLPAADYWRLAAVEARARAVRLEAAHAVRHADAERAACLQSLDLPADGAALVLDDASLSVTITMHGRP